MEDGKCVKMICDDGYLLVGDNCNPLCNEENEKWDEKTQRCEKTECPKGQKLKDGKCHT